MTAALGLFVGGLSDRFHQLRAFSLRAGPAVRGDPLGPLTTVLRAALSANVYPLIVLTQEILLVSGLTFVGLILFWRKRQQWQAVLFSLAMITYGPYITGSLDALVAAHPAWQAPVRLVQTIGIGGAVLSGYLFPDGLFIPRWTRFLSLSWLAWLLAGAIFPGLFLNFARPYALAIPGLVALIVWLLTTLAAQADRYRRAADGIQRRQTRWVLVCMTNTIVTYSAFMLPYALLPSLSVPGTQRLYILIGYPIFLLSLPVSPLIIFIAMLRRQLFDIDTVLNRALVYVTLTFALALIYAAGILVLGYLLNGLTGGSQLAVVSSTLTTAALFRPLRGRIQQGIDRRFYRRRYDAAKTLAAFRATLHRDVDLQQVCEHVVGLVEETMQPAHLSLWLPPAGWDDSRRRETLSPRED